MQIYGVIEDGFDFSNASALSLYGNLLMPAVEDCNERQRELRNTLEEGELWCPPYEFEVDGSAMLLCMVARQLTLRLTYDQNVRAWPTIIAENPVVRRISAKTTKTRGKVLDRVVDSKPTGYLVDLLFSERSIGRTVDLIRRRIARRVREGKEIPETLLGFAFMVAIRLFRHTRGRPYALVPKEAELFGAKFKYTTMFTLSVERKDAIFAGQTKIPGFVSAALFRLYKDELGTYITPAERNERIRHLFDPLPLYDQDIGMVTVDLEQPLYRALVRTNHSLYRRPNNLWEKFPAGIRQRYFPESRTMYDVVRAWYDHERSPFAQYALDDTTNVDYVAALPTILACMHDRAQQLSSLSLLGLKKIVATNESSHWLSHIKTIYKNDPTFDGVKVRTLIRDISELHVPARANFDYAYFMEPKTRMALRNLNNTYFPRLRKQTKPVEEKEEEEEEEEEEEDEEEYVPDPESGSGAEDYSESGYSSETGEPPAAPRESSSATVTVPVHTNKMTPASL